MCRRVICRTAALVFLAAALHPFEAGAQNVITTIAGASDFVFPRTVRALEAPLDAVTCAATDAQGNVYLCEATRHIVARVSRDGTLTVVAGNGIRRGGFSGDGGPATSASLNYPASVAVDGSGNVYIADRDNNRVRKVSPDGVISTVAGNGQLAFSGDGGPGPSAALAAPRAVAVDRAGVLYIADTGNQRIRKVLPSGTISTAIGAGIVGYVGYPFGVAVDASGNLYVGEPIRELIHRLTPQGSLSVISTPLNSPEALAVDAGGNIYFAESRNYRVVKVSPLGTLTVAAGGGTGGLGDGGPATSAALKSPSGVAVDAAGVLYIADTGNQRLRRVSSGGTITTLAGSGLTTFFGEGGPATAGGFNGPNGLAADSAGNLYIVDTKHHRVRKISSAGILTTVAGNGVAGFSGDGGPAASAALNTPEKVAVDAAGNIYISDRNNHRIRKVTPQGIISTAARASSDNGPWCVAADAGGSFYFGQDGYPGRIVKVGPAGSMSTVATVADSFPNAIAPDPAGNLYVSLSSSTGLADRIVKVTPSGAITTVAGGGRFTELGDGGPATGASFNGLQDLTLDAAGNLYIADSGNQRIRKVNAQGIINTVAGNGRADFFGDGGPATSASLNGAEGVAVDAAGNLYIADTGNNRIRAVLARQATSAVSPTSLSFTASAGSPEVVPQQLTLSGNVLGLSWETTAVFTDRGGAWLTISPPAGQMPALVTVSVDATNLAAGVYRGTIEISVPGATPSLHTASVTLTVSSAQAAGLSVQPTTLTFQMVSGGTAPPAQTLRIENTGGGTLNWRAVAATFSGNWLAISPQSGNAPAGVQVSVNPAGLAAGAYSGTILILADNNQSVTVPVNLLFSRPAAVVLLSQTSLLFRAVEGGGAEPPQTFGVLNVGSGTLDWTVQATEPWLRVSPGNGRSDAGATQIPLVNVSVEPAGLAAGFYVGLLRVTAAAANNSPQVLRLDLQVLPRGTRLGAVVRPTGLIFVAAAGGASPGSQEVGVATAEATPMEFLSQPIGGPWVRRLPESGAASRDNPGRIVVLPELGSLAAGVYRAGLTVLIKEDGSLHPVSLLLLVLPQGTAIPTALAREEWSRLPLPAFACTPSQLFVQFGSLFTNFNAAVGWPTNVLVSARDDCGNPAVGGTLSLTFSSGDPPLALTDLKNGQYQGSWRPTTTSPQVVVTARGFWRGLQGQAAAVAQVGLNPNPQAANLSQGGVLLGAGFERGPLAPGSIVSLFGRNLAAGPNFASSLPLPRTLGKVRVLIAGMEAPLFFVGPGQVNAQVPAELPPDRQLQVLVEINGVPSAPEPLQTVSNRPGIFTLGGAFGNQGAILIANTDRLAMPVTPNVPSEPARVGGFISIYCTGLGATEPEVPSGEPAAPGRLAVVKTPVTVTVGGQPATVHFAGLAPGLVAVYQVNVQVPSGVTPGDAVPVVLTQGGFRSNSATIAVR